MQQKYYIRFPAFYALYYVSLVILSLFLPVFFSRQGLGRGAIGTIMAVGPFVGLLAQPFWGTVADRSRDKTRILALLVFCAGIASLSFYLSTRLLFVLAAMAVFTFFHISVEPIGHGVTLEYLAAAGRKFGPVRMVGTISFSISAVAAGVLMGGDIRLVFLLFAGFSVLAAAVAWTMPRIPGHQSEGRRISMLRLLKNRELVLLTLFSGIVSMTLFFYYVFFPIYFTEMGADTVLLGLSATISAVPEIAVLVFADKIYARLGARTMVLGAGTVLAVRWILYYLIPNPLVILALQSLHGLTFIVLSFALTYFISESVRPELKASGQTFHALFVAVVCRIIGTMAGGFVSEAAGIRRVFLYNGILAGAAVVVFAVIFARVRSDSRPPEDGP